MKKLLVISIFSGLIFLFSCKKDLITESKLDSDINLFTKKTDSFLLKTFFELGINQRDILDLEDYYLVFGDLLFKKNSVDIERVKKYFNKGATKSLDSFLRPQAYTNNIVNSTNIDVVRVYFAAGTFDPWEFPTRIALQHWANIVNCKLNFYWSWAGISPDITVGSDNGALPVNQIAAAEFPSIGNPGWRIRFNADFYQTAPGNQVAENNRGSNMIYNMVHEIGHTIGLRHTNWRQLGESAAPIGANLVPGTNNNDAASVMNGGTALNLWNRFSNGDILAGQFLYPYLNLDNLITYPEGDFSANSTNIQVSYAGFPIRWNSALINTSTVTLQLYQNKTLLGNIESGIPNNGYYEFTQYSTFFPFGEDALYCK